MKVAFRKSFTKDLKHHAKSKTLLPKAQRIIMDVESAEVIRKIANLKKLKTEGPYFRIRVGNYRIGLIIENDTVTFVRILDRREIYRHFPA